MSPTSWSHHWVWVAPALLVAAAHGVAVALPGWAGGHAWPWPRCSCVAPHQWGLPRAGEQELAWTPLQQVVGSTYVWFTVLLFVLLWLAVRGPDGRPAGRP